MVCYSKLTQCVAYQNKFQTGNYSNTCANFFPVRISAWEHTRPAVQISKITEKRDSPRGLLLGFYKSLYENIQCSEAFPSAWDYFFFKIGSLTIFY